MKRRKSKEQISAEKLRLRFLGYSKTVIKWLYSEPGSFALEGRDVDEWIADNEVERAERRAQSWAENIRTAAILEKNLTLRRRAIEIASAAKIGGLSKILGTRKIDKI